MAAKAVSPRLRASIYRALDRAGPCSRRTAPKEKATPSKALANVAAAVIPYSIRIASRFFRYCYCSMAVQGKQGSLSCPAAGCKGGPGDV